MEVKLLPPTGDPGTVVYGLEPQPDQDWINRFNARVGKSPTPIQLGRNVKLGNGSIRLNCATDADLQALTDQVKKVVNEVNTEENDWDARLKKVQV